MPRNLKQLPSLTNLLTRLIRSHVMGKSNDARQFLGDTIGFDGLKLSMDHCKAYADICGYPNASTLPYAYPQIVASPLMYELLLARAFPFRMLGLIHTSHAITQHRALSAQSKLNLSCSTHNLHTVSHGYAFQLNSQVRDGEALAWESEATFLFRTKVASAPRTKRRHAEATKDQTGFERVATHELPADLGRRYAKISMDYNPIHLSPWTAKLFGFKQPIAHGLWLVGWVTANLSGVANMTIDFKAPIFLPNRIDLLTRVGENGGEFIVKAAKGPRVYAEGRFVLA